MYKIIYLLLFGIGGLGFAQQQGLIIEEYGKVYKVENADLEFDNNKVYKVIFDIYTDSPDLDKKNPLLKTVARYLQIHTQYGVPEENLKVAVIMHGVATKNVLTDEAFKKEFKTKNPNAELIKVLKDANVELFVCGQSYARKGYEKEQKLPEVKMALSAMTALVWFQSGGYQFINFN